MKLERAFQAVRCLAVAACLSLAFSPSLPAQDDQQPIAYIGHGAFFDSQGNEILLTQEFVDKAQGWYREYLLRDLPLEKRKDFDGFEKWLGEDFRVDGQARLVVRHAALEWLFANSSRLKEDDRTLGKLRALATALTWHLPERAGPKPTERKEFKFDAALWQKLDAWRKGGGGIQVLSATLNLGQAYINECAAAQVPIPPSINVMDPAGLTGWKSQGFIPTNQQFIGQGGGPSPAEVRTFSSPQGMCIALPRYTNTSQTTVSLDGVICLSRITSKVCFWDNQMMGSTFSFPAGTRIPIGLANLAVDPAGRYQAGGFELLGGAGGVCTDCHAGENPYIVHPNSDLDPGAGTLLFGSLQGAPQNLPMFSPNRYDPLVAAAWPQNQLSQTAATSPAVCVGCHVKAGAGRFPHLSNQLPGYCNTVLAQGITRTMPPNNPGGEATNPQVASFRSNWCGAGPNSSSADAGDPHITTTNGIHYDFQAAGEFVALKNSDSGFELQTRQSPILTSFIPGANPYTGLQSCVSLNTAVALRVGRHRVTYQPIRGGFTSRERLELRIDGSLVTAARVDFGDGNVINKSTTDGELDVRTADGTRVVVTPLFWASEGYWYLDVAVFTTPAREGVMGHILAHDWLPLLPDGSSLGSRPVALLDRHVQLNQKFADAWRVSTTTSLFDYATGLSTADFTDRNWPSEPGKSCATTTVRGPAPYVKEPRPDLAKKACSGIRNAAIRANCEFDVTVMGDANAARGHRRQDALTN
jgi:hypothetical protein